MFVYQVTVGTNPLSVAAPGKDGDSFVLDMATSAVALGKVSDQINPYFSSQVGVVITNQNCVSVMNRWVPFVII